MSEEVVYNVEDGPAPPDPTPAPPEPQAQADGAGESATPPAEPIVEAPDVEVDGQKMVPLSALQAERANVKALKDKAQKFDEVTGWYTQNKPYVDFLQAHPELITQRQPQAAPAPAAPAPPEQDQKLVNLARVLDLYTPEGQPDAKRALALRDFMRSEAQGTAQEAVRPFADMTVREKSNANYRDALNQTLPDGRKPDPAILKQIWDSTDPKILADPQSAAAAVFLAAGFSAFNQQPAPAQPAAPTMAPVVSEPAGRVSGTRAPVSEFEQRVASIRGITPQKYAGYLKDFKSGAPNALED